MPVQTYAQTDASDYLENELLDHVFDNSSFTSPTTIYMALYSTACNDAGGGTELSGNGYARQSVSFGTASSGTISNDVAVTFTASGGDWSTASHFGLLDALTTGNLLACETLSSSVTVEDTENLEFGIGDIDVSLD